jgi:hypothetical protein
VNSCEYLLDLLTPLTCLAVDDDFGAWIKAFNADEGLWGCVEP